MVLKALCLTKLDLISEARSNLPVVVDGLKSDSNRLTFQELDSLNGVDVLLGCFLAVF